MKKTLTLIAILIAGFCVYWFMLRSKKNNHIDTSEKPIAQSKHSAVFNKSIDAVITAYLSAKDGLAKEDTSIAKTATATMIAALDAIDMKELAKDSNAIIETAQASINDVKANAESLLRQTNIDEMRRDFSALTDMMYPAFFSAVNYEGRRLYFYHCNMAFNNQGANWITNVTEPNNPYMGGSTPDCSELKDSIAGMP
ncbi:MAG: DUF3347 domain-containing protein [Niastella sp.]|nr:DUF3347 domain-containing protein [Niastella sp.]